MTYLFYNWESVSLTTFTRYSNLPPPHLRQPSICSIYGLGFFLFLDFTFKMWDHRVFVIFWLISCGIMPWSPSVLSQMARLLPFFLWLSNTPHLRYLFICQSTPPGIPTPSGTQMSGTDECERPLNQAFLCLIIMLSLQWSPVNLKNENEDYFLREWN